ncbi:MAG: hypothetical protein GY945_14050, partial [Rhodobacteraceae bacterium]|nr:hypothetical protein [Paracoccaceae bacterium]
LPARSGELRHFQVIFEGFERDFNLYVPTGLEENQEPYPLVFVLHGIASTNELVMEKSRGRFNQLADQYGFLVAYPNGLARHWAVGEGEAAALVLPKRDDLAFLDQVLTLSGQLFPVDRTRIFATGFSLGGQMSFAWACNRPGLVRAVATVAMTLPEFMIETCRDSTPFGVAMIHGTADPAVPYYGGSFPVGPKPRDVFLSHDKTLAFFMAQNGCDPAEYQTLVLDEFDDETSVMRRVWENCAGPSLHSYTILAGGHSWPREDQPLTTRAVVGRVSREITGSDQMWEFFQRFE